MEGHSEQLKPYAQNLKYVGQHFHFRDYSRSLTTGGKTSRGRTAENEASVRGWVPEPRISSPVFRSWAFIHRQMGAISMFFF